MADSIKTIALLDELEQLGFTNEAFRRLHHFREGKGETINGHRSYCEKMPTFDHNGNNERVQIRLGIVLKYYKAYQGGNPEIFVRLADAAYTLVPPLPPRF